MMWDVPLQISCIVRKEKKEKKKRQKDAFLFLGLGCWLKRLSPVDQPSRVRSARQADHARNVYRLARSARHAGNPVRVCAGGNSKCCSGSGICESLGCLPCAQVSWGHFCSRTAAGIIRHIDFLNNPVAQPYALRPGCCHPRAFQFCRHAQVDKGIRLHCESESMAHGVCGAACLAMRQRVNAFFCRVNPFLRSRHRVKHQLVVALIYNIVADGGTKWPANWERFLFAVRAGAENWPRWT